MTPFRKWIGEIHRRAFWQTLGMYSAGSWVALQVVDVLANSLELPRWIPVGVILLIVAGFPVTLLTAVLQAGRAPAEGEAVSGERADPIPEEKSAPASEPSEASEPSIPHDSPALGSLESLRLRRLFTWRNAIGAGVSAFAVWGFVAAGWLVLAGRTGGQDLSQAPELDDGVVAVLPFRIFGQGDLEFLGEGMVDLLAAKLTGEGGLRAANPRSVMSAWHRMTGDGNGDFDADASVALARSLGAGQVMTGGIVGTPSRMIITASVLDVENGARRVQASVERSLDSLTATIDQLTVRLLALEAEREDQRLAALTSTSLQAVRAYLDGQAAYRRGGYSEANRHFERALESDSTFAVAALAWVSSAWWSPGYDLYNRARATAWNLRDRLSDRDRALLAAWAGPRYPLTSGWAEHLVRWDLAIAAAPERPPGHGGASLGVPPRLDSLLRLDPGTGRVRPQR
jgi:TolB-like protein